MEKIKTIIDEKSTKEFVSNSFKLAFIGVGAALVCVAIYILFGVLNNSWSDPLSIVLLVLGGVILLFSVILIVLLIKSINKASQFPRTVIYDLQDDYISFEIYRNEEVIEKGKLHYQDLSEYKETKSFVFVGLKSNNSWLGIQKVDGLVDFIKSKGLVKFRYFKSSNKK